MLSSTVHSLVLLSYGIYFVTAVPSLPLPGLRPRSHFNLRNPSEDVGVYERNYSPPKEKRLEEQAPADELLQEYPIDDVLLEYKPAGEEGNNYNVGYHPGYKVGYKPCVHGPLNRGCWTPGFSISTDMDESWPNTGRTVKYYWEVTNATLAPDGVEKNMMVINGQYPGPAIEANWGDDIEVYVKNSMNANGTGIHWHGVRQFKTNHMDGVGGVTECPIAKGETKVYRFKATQFGTSWYHSHYSVQYGDGVVGGIVIKGPATRNYDIDLGFYPFTDWFHASVFTINAMALHANGPPTADNFLVNGTHISRSGGKHAVTTLTPGKKHLLRMVNVGINQFVHVSLDGHSFEVVAADFVPIVPYTTKSLAINVGQRYDIIITADQPIGDYWLRVETGGGKCDGPNTARDEDDGIRARFNYEGSRGLPVEVEPFEQPANCVDETNLVPWIPTKVPKDTPQTMEIGFTNEATDDNLVQWLINGSRMAVDFERPTLQNIRDGNMTFDSRENAYAMTKGAEWSYWVVQADEDSGRVPHPIHLHGHDFYILDRQENATWAGDISRLKLDNPTRRDTATLPKLGYLVLAFQADNPGAWLMHCHVPFHISAGFSMQFLEDQENIVSTIGDFTDFNAGCDSWKTFQNSTFPDGFTQGDSLVKREVERDGTDAHHGASLMKRKEESEVGDAHYAVYDE